MKRTCPDKEFIPVPPEIPSEEANGTVSCGCNECQYMKLNTLQKVYDCLKNESPAIEIDPEIAREAVKPIERMLELS
jgi:quinolinate synthase